MYFCASYIFWKGNVHVFLPKYQPIIQFYMMSSLDEWYRKHYDNNKKKKRLKLNRTVWCSDTVRLQILLGSSQGLSTDLTCHHHLLPPSVPQPMKGLLTTLVLSVCSHMFLACLSLTPLFCPSLSLLLCTHHSSVCLSTFLLVCPYPFSKVPPFPQINPLYQICCMVPFLRQTPWHGPLALRYLS